MLSESFYLKLATACKNLFLSLVVVRLVIFFKSFFRLIRLNPPSILNFSFLNSLKVCFLMLWQWRLAGAVPPWLYSLLWNLGWAWQQHHWNKWQQQQQTNLIEQRHNFNPMIIPTCYLVILVSWTMKYSPFLLIYLIDKSKVCEFLTQFHNDNIVWWGHWWHWDKLCCYLEV